MQPQLIVALGTTAARTLTGRNVTIARERGRVVALAPDRQGLITVHPSFLLRLPDAAAQDAAYREFIADLRVVAEQLPAIRAAA